MKTKLLRALLPMALVFTLISCSPDSASEEVATPQARLIQDYNYQPEELELADLINEYRASKGLKTLHIINHVSFKSEEHNEYMISKKVVNHDLFQERAENIIEVLGAVKVNENIAYNFSTPNSALYAWLKSSGHKANIEGDFTDFGVSIRVDPNKGDKYYNNIFIKK